MSAARFPKRRHIGDTLSTSMMSLQLSLARQQAILDAKGFTGRSVLGFKLPEFQRPLVWTESQNQRFIESIWMGVDIGTYMVNTCMDNEAIDWILIDGQQRLNAIELYWNDAFAVKGDDGNYWFWSQLDEREQANLLRINFPWRETHYTTVEEVKEAYDRFNFGGTPHTQDQRAIPLDT